MCVRDRAAHLQAEATIGIAGKWCWNVVRVPDVLRRECAPDVVDLGESYLDGPYLLVEAVAQREALLD